MSERERRTSAEDLASSSHDVESWLLALAGPLLAVTELAQGNVLTGLGLAGVTLMMWTELAERLEYGDPRLTRAGLACGIAGGLLLLVDTLRWWVGYLR